MVEAPAPLPAERFTHWAAQRLGLQLEPLTGDVFRFLVPQNEPAFEGANEVRFTFNRAAFDAASPDSALELVAPGGRLLTWLIERVRTLGNVTHAAPRHEPANVHELAGPLLDAYQVDQGRTHLAGCTMETVPLLRLTYRLRLEGLEPRDELLDIYTGPDGQVVAPEIVAELNLNDLVPLAAPPKIARTELERIIHAASTITENRRRQSENTLAESLLPRKLAELQQLEDYFDKLHTEIAGQRTVGMQAEEGAALDEQLANLAEQRKRRVAAIEERYSVQGRVELAAAILIWCKLAAGKVRFTIGGTSHDLPFRDWAALLKAPSFVCPYTQRASFHIAATDDGRLVAAEELGTCDVSGERTLRKELVTCAVTGKTVVARLAGSCPVTGKPILRELLRPCPICTVPVSPQATSGKVCLVCPTPKSADKDEPRLARVLHEYPRLDQWRSWKLAETAIVYLLHAAGFWRQLSLVVDKNTLEVLRIASKSRLSTQWSEVPKTGYDEVLR